MTATRTKPAPPADTTPSQFLAQLAAAPDVEGMDAPAILAELGTLVEPLTVVEDALNALRARRLALWCAARLLPKGDQGDVQARPIFMGLAEASVCSEALVIKHTKNEFKRRGIDPPR